MTVLTTRRQNPAPADVRTVDGWGFAALGQIASRIRAIDPDIVHLQYQTAAFAMSPAVSLLPYVARLAGKGRRFVATFHDLRAPYLFPGAGKARRAPARILLGASDACVFTAPEDAIAARPRRRAAWIPLGPGVLPSAMRKREAAREGLQIDSQGFAIGYFGFMNSSKGLETLLHAAKLLSEKDVAFQLVFIGEDRGASDETNAATAASVRSLESQFGLEGRVIRTGRLPANKVSWALAAVDVAALPYADGASLRRSSLITCLAHGVPVVTTAPRTQAHLPSEYTLAPFDEPSQYRIDNRVAALVPPGDPAGLAEELQALARDPARRSALARGGQEFAERLAWPGIAGATASFYHGVLKDNA